MNINKESQDVIRILMENSFWGQNSSIDSLLRDFESEVSEFWQGCKANDSENSMEEAADVLMIMLCILYKMSRETEQPLIEQMVEAMVEKLKRRYEHLYEEHFSKDIDESDIWRNAKSVESVANYMYCDNPECKYYGKIGAKNIRIVGNKYICEECCREIYPSRQNVLFYNKQKYRKKYIQMVVNSILEFVHGNVKAPELLAYEEEKVFGYFCKDILQSEDNFRTRFADYVCEKYKVPKVEVLRYCDLADEIVTKDRVEEYCKGLCEKDHNILDRLSDKEIHKMRTEIKDKTIDVVKKIEKAVKYEARNWDNQLVHKYLLRYDDKRIIECMLIIHYAGEAVRDLTIELSNMYNCVVGCRFCASGALPETACELEAMDYVRQLNTCVEKSGIDPNEFKEFYVSFAGIGEPSIVYKKIAEGMRIIQDIYPHVKYNVATFGFRKECFAYWNQLNLPIRTFQIPIYSLDRNVLKRIVSNLPDTYSLEGILEEVVQYKMAHLECRIKINFIVMKDINDSDHDIEVMCDFLEKYKKEIAVKISYLNYTKPGEMNHFTSPGSKRLTEIKEYLKDRGFCCYIFGTAFNSELGCGQLVQDYISSNC